MPFTKKTTTVQDVPVSIIMRLGLDPQDRFSTEIFICLHRKVEYYESKRLMEELKPILTPRFAFNEKSSYDKVTFYIYGGGHLSVDDVSKINHFFTQFDIKEEDSRDFLKWARLLSVHKT